MDTKILDFTIATAVEVPQRAIPIRAHDGRMIGFSLDGHDYRIYSDIERDEDRIDDLKLADASITYEILSVDAEQRE